MIDYNRRLEDMKKIIDWYYSGYGQIGGSLGLFLRLPIERIEELYNVKFN